jgi:hypothetical protein
MSKINWKLVEDQFRDRPKGTIQKLANIWAKRMGVKSLEMDDRRTVKEEYWSHDRLYQLLKSMQPHEPEMFTKRKPRNVTRPLIIVKSEDVYFMIDGRRRSNVFIKKPGKYRVLVIS